MRTKVHSFLGAAVALAGLSNLFSPPPAAGYRPGRHRPVEVAGPPHARSFLRTRARRHAPDPPWTKPLAVVF